MTGIRDRIRPAVGTPEGALVLFHGRGADEHDLMPLIEVLDPEQRLVGVTPRAPLSLPPGGAHWYIVERVGYPHEETFMASVELLSDWLDELPDRIGVPEEKIVLGGFSQGRAAPPALLAMVGFIPHVDAHPLDLSSPDRPAVTIVHGSIDPVIDVSFGRAARDELLAAEMDVTYRETAVEHTIDSAWLPDLRHQIGMTLR